MLVFTTRTVILSVLAIIVFASFVSSVSKANTASIKITYTVVSTAILAAYLYCMDWQ